MRESWTQRGGHSATISKAKQIDLWLQPGRGEGAQRQCGSAIPEYTTDTHSTGASCAWLSYHCLSAPNSRLTETCCRGQVSSARLVWSFLRRGYLRVAAEGRKVLQSLWLLHSGSAEHGRSSNGCPYPGQALGDLAASGWPKKPSWGPPDMATGAPNVRPRGVLPGGPALYMDELLTACARPALWKAASCSPRAAS